MLRASTILLMAFMITACQGALPESQPAVNSTIASITPSSPSPTQPVYPTLDLDPSPTLETPAVYFELKEMSLSDGEPPNFIESTGSPLEAPGTYVIYRNSSGTLKYISLDGKTSGVLFDYSDASPERRFVAGQVPGFVFSPSFVPLEENHYVWLTDLTGHPLKSWIIIKDQWCLEQVFSPQGNWGVVKCFSRDWGLYLNMVGLQVENEQKAYHLPCYDAIAIFPPRITWSSDDNNFMYDCRPYVVNIYCFISVADDDVVCKPIRTEGMDTIEYGLKVLSVSPDWSTIILDLGYQPATEDGLVPGLRILIAELDCVLQKDFCDQGVTLKLPFAFPYDPETEENNPKPDLQLLWNTARNELIWMTSSEGEMDGTSQKRHIVGWFELSTGENHIFERDWAKNTELVSISPDGNWLLFHKSNRAFPPHKTGYFAMSLEDEAVHHVVWDAPMSGFIQFYGWLTIP